MRVLVAFASRFGSTRLIAERLAARLGAAGLEVRCRSVADIDEVTEDAVVVGSAVYFGHWLRPGTEFVQHHRDRLVGRPTWLFSSGPLPPDASEPDDELAVTCDPEEVATFAAWFVPRDHAVFGGTLGGRDPSAEDAGERERIDGWADAIAAELARLAPIGDDPPRDQGPPRT